MDLVLNILLIFILGVIFYQDIQERKVTLLVLISGIVIGGLIHFQHQQWIVFVSNIFVNITFIALIFLLLLIYAKLKMKKNIFDVFGKGDLLFFILLGISLPILSFVMVFVFSLIFSLIIFLLLKKKFTNQTVPLAGLQSLFLGLVLIANKITPSINLYAL
jgi:hypothetical protein